MVISIGSPHKTLKRTNSTPAIIETSKRQKSSDQLPIPQSYDNVNKSSVDEGHDKLEQAGVCDAEGSNNLCMETMKALETGKEEEMGNDEDGEEENDDD